jgi:hypothetical protein
MARLRICFGSGELGGLALLRRIDNELLPGFCIGPSNPRVEADGCRHDEAIVIVSVFADQIYPSGSPEKSGFTLEVSVKLRTKFSDYIIEACALLGGHGCSIPSGLRFELRIVENTGASSKTGIAPPGARPETT